VSSGKSSLMLAIKAYIIQYTVNHFLEFTLGSFALSNNFRKSSLNSNHNTTFTNIYSNLRVQTWKLMFSTEKMSQVKTITAFNNVTQRSVDVFSGRFYRSNNASPLYSNKWSHIYSPCAVSAFYYQTVCTWVTWIFNL
jgi:hypothetical protein